MKRIIIDCTCIKNFTTGVGNYSYFLLKNFELPENWSVTLLVEDSLDEEHKLLRLANCHNWIIEKRKCPAIGPQRQWFFFKEQNFFSKFDLYHCLHSNAPIFMPCRKIVTIHDLKYVLLKDMLGSASWIKSFYLNLIFRSAVHQYDRVIAVSESTKKDLISSYGNKFNNKILVIYEAPCLVNLIEDNIDNQDFIASKYSDLANFIFFLGENRKHKNVDGLISAYERLPLALQEQYPLFIGGKPHKSFELRVQNNQNIKLLGYLSDAQLQQCYEKCYLYILPSFYEGFGLPILEAQFFGKPIITSNISSMPEILGEGGVKVNPYDIDEISNALKELLINQSKYKTLREKAKENVQKFSWEKAATETIQVYRDALNQEV